MKHKYTIIKNAEKNQLILKEYGELDKEMMTFLCQASYEDEEIMRAIQKGKDSLVETLRTENMYPPNLYADRIAEAVLNLYKENPEGQSQSVEITFDDLEWLTRDQEEYPFEEEYEDEPEEDIEDLLEDDFEEEDDLRIPNSSLKIADDDSGDFDDEG